MTGSELLSALGGKIAPFDLNGVVMWLKPLSLPALVEYKAIPETDIAGRMVALVAGSVCDEAGNLSLTPAQAASLPASVVDKITRRIVELNGFDQDADSGKAS